MRTSNPTELCRLCSCMSHLRLIIIGVRQEPHYWLVLTFYTSCPPFLSLSSTIPATSRRHYYIRQTVKTPSLQLFVLQLQRSLHICQNSLSCYLEFWPWFDWIWERLIDSNFNSFQGSRQKKKNSFRSDSLDSAVWCLWNWLNHESWYIWFQFRFPIDSSFVISIEIRSKNPQRWFHRSMGFILSSSSQFQIRFNIH